MPIRTAWRLRDILITAALFLATAGFVLWQNAHVAVLWDLSYLLDSSYRISLGQIPYKDFPFAHAPLTFLLHAALIRLFGRVYTPHVLFAATEAGAAAVLSWRILRRLLAPDGDGNAGRPARESAWIEATLLAAPLVFLSIYGIYPHPEYDSDAILAVLVVLFLLLRDSSAALPNLCAGFLCVVTVFFKQNIGLIFLMATCAATITLVLLRLRRQLPVSRQAWFLAGAALAGTASAAAVHATAGLHNYFYWTITFARQRRSPGFALMLETYRQPSLLWTIPAAVLGLSLLRRTARWARGAATLLLAAPFLWTLLSLALSDDPADRADQLLSLWPHVLLLGAGLALWSLRPKHLAACPEFEALLPAVLLATIHGTFLSQQLWGSTYALWSLLLLLIAMLLMRVPTIAHPLAATVSVPLLICGGLYAVSHERLSYVHLEGEIARATLPSLQGLATPGPWIPGFEELVRVTDAEIPAADGILLIPGENPFYFATGRVQQFPFELFDPATDPYTTGQTREAVHERNIRWLIVNRETQLTAPPEPGLAEATEEIEQDFVLYRTLTNYTIYRRK